jgi:hypothetical protein
MDAGDGFTLAFFVVKNIIMKNLILRSLFSVLILTLVCCAKHPEDILVPETSAARIVNQPGPFTNFNIIKIAVDSTIERGWQEALVKEVQEWNSLKTITFLFVNSGWDVRVEHDTLSALYAAISTMPYDDKPGMSITINDLQNGAPAIIKNAILRHELGHILGIRHITDRVSFINPSVTATTVFTDEDIRMIRKLF